MPVCRICLQQSYKNVYDGNDGEPSVIDKLKSCMHSLDVQMIDAHFCVCEECMHALNSAYELNEKLIAAQNDIRAQMTDANATDYANLNKYAFDASLLRQKMMDAEVCPKIEEEHSIYMPEETSEEASPEMQMNVNFERLSRFMEGKMCHICYRQYPNRTCLQSHVRSVHMAHASGNNLKRRVLNNMLSTLTPQELRRINAEVAKQCTRTSCDVCRITMKCTHEMRYHLTAVHRRLPVANVHFNIVCDICGMEFSHTYLALHQRGHQLQVRIDKVDVQRGRTGPFMLVPLWKCPFCRAEYRRSEFAMRQHLRTHHLFAIECTS